MAALRPWTSDRRFSNFAEEAVEPESIFEPETLARLRTVRAHYDPSELFVASHRL